MHKIVRFKILAEPCLALILSATGIAFGQTRPIADAQIEADVLRALAGAPELATQAIKTTTVYGTVTLSGSVTDESSRSLAESLASKAPGVQKVVDELTVGGASESGNEAPASGGSTQQAPGTQSQQDPGSTPMLQSDGTMAPAAGQDQGQDQRQAPEPGYVSPPAPAQSQRYPDDASGKQGQDLSQVYRRPYGSSRSSQYGQQGPPPYGSQEAGKPVTVAAGSLIRVRLNEGLTSRQAQPGTVFDGVVLNDVVGDGEVAIPRGALVSGSIVEVNDPGKVSGRGLLALQLTSVTLGGKVFPIVSDTWSHEGRDNTGRTVGNAIGLGAFGAIIGAVAGGGPGAAIGAVAGGAAGVGVSAAQGRGQVVVPAEAILSFHLTQPAGLTTVSQSEIDRLGYGVQQTRMYRRPPPPPGYYGRPVYYPYPY